MDGEFIDVWPASWREVWTRLARHRAAPDDFFCGLYDETVGSLTPQLDAQEHAEIINDPVQARVSFKKMVTSGFDDERALVGFLERLYEAINEWGGDSLANRYFGLLNAFVNKYSLRYDLRRPCTLCPTLPGMFTSLFRDLNGLGLGNDNIARRLKDFREAIQDLRVGQTEGRIANCVTKQVMLLEAVGATATGVTGTELSTICSQTRQWPHPAMRSSLLKLYGFASDVPGFRHGTPSTGMLRDIDMRDLVALSILFIGFTPYLSDQFNGDVVYQGH